LSSCGAAGEGDFAAVFDRSPSPEALKDCYADYGTDVIPHLWQAAV
jgi:hypothetical protein